MIIKPIFLVSRTLSECDCSDFDAIKSHYVFSDGYQSILCEYCSGDYAGQNEVDVLEVNPL